MDFFNINKKKLDIANDNLEIKNYEKQDTFTKFNEVIDNTGKAFGALGCKTCELATEVAKTGIDDQKEKFYNEYKEAKRGGIEESVKTMRNLTDADIEMFEKRLQEEENEKRLKEQQMDKNITSPTSSLTKPVYLLFHGQTNEI